MIGPVIPVCIRNWLECLENEQAKNAGLHKDNPSLLRLVSQHLLCAAIECHSGLKFSAQASPYHYCDLRDLGDFETGGGCRPITKDRMPTCFEVMVFTDRVPEGAWVHPELVQSGYDEPSGWVSIEAIEQTIHENGGWVKDPPPEPDRAPNLTRESRRMIDL